MRSNYRTVVNDKEFERKMNSVNRFKTIEERDDRSDVPCELWLPLVVQNGYHTHWKNIICNKSSFEFAIYPMLIQEVRPKTIIELGALNGGSALWLADLLSISQINGLIYSIDIDLSLLHRDVIDDDRITFIQGDCNRIEDVLPKALLGDMPHPWLIIEDCHVNTGGILDYFHHNGVIKDDYIIIEDTNKDALAIRNDPSLGNMYLPPDKIKEKSAKMDILRAWLIDRPEYKVDTFYLDMFGYNVSKNWNSVLKRF